MGYATKQTGEDYRGQGGEVRIIRTEEIGGTLVNVMQTTLTETTNYIGLCEADAKALASPYDATTNPGGLIKTSLGGIKVTVTNGLSTAWFSVFSCRGTIETASCERMGNSSLFAVHYTKQTLSVSTSGGTIENI